MSSLDLALKKYYPAVIGGLVALTAYLEAAGISSLLAEQFLAQGRAPVEAKDAPARPASVMSDKNGSVILVRNPFDSKTGRLDKKKVAVAPEPETPMPAPTRDNAPKCSSGNVLTITHSSDPAFSFAMLKKGTETRLRRVGDEIDGHVVTAIDRERVVLDHEGAICELRMHEGGLLGGALEKPTATPSMPIRPSSATEKATPSGGIRKVSENEYVIEGKGQDKLAQIKEGFLKNSKLVDGEGVRLYRSAQASVLGQVGLQKGDVIQKINGFDMSSIDQTAEVYGRLPDAKELSIELTREGKPVTVHVQIQ